ncbi:MAG: valine--tRNA ligase [Simkaniaceae bacterium]
MCYAVFLMKDIPKTYIPGSIEQKWYDFWEGRGLFVAKADSGKPPFTVMLPPPNVTGVLHMGHALVDTLQDAIVRWKRMCGYETLWLPGTDHAGISTQTVVERHLIAKEGKRRKDYSREEFLKHVWLWKEKNESRIISQLKKLGCSCDWSRQRFTMDEGANRAVRTIFKKLFNEGLIYRGDYLVNWDPVTQTALADDEVEYEEADSCLWYFRYPLASGDNYVIIATTRPETMLGDTAVAVAPSDERYESLIGKEILLPIMQRKIPIVADHFVDPEFGTGAVKITPAHDPNDREVGLRHQLPSINIMTPDGHINENGGEFQGLTMAQARQAVIKRMKELGLLEKIVPHKHRVGVSYRSKAVIEPYLSKQWFVKMKPFKQKLLDAVNNGKVSLIPDYWKSTYFHWIENLRDWCISRQLWWGHRIPIWYNQSDPEKMICHAGDGLPEEVQKNPQDWKQDEDVLDTWFSSALWPFSTLGWPEKTQDLEKFYPNSILMTGHDILFFWVARMILMGEYTLGQVPFSECFIHGLIYGKSYWRENEEGSISYVTPEEREKFELGEKIPEDVHSKWEKMSKSKGNVIDPIEIIENYGADAMRLTLCSITTHARQIDLDRRRFEEFKNFANKIWNGARFIFLNLEGLSAEAFTKGLDSNLFTLEDKWILSRLNRTVLDMNRYFTNYDFDQAAMLSYSFFWDEVCAYYLELAKPFLFEKQGNAEIKENKQKLLVVLLLAAIRLMHPMAPFITEELFHLLKDHFKEFPDISPEPYTGEAITALKQPSIMISRYPEVFKEEDINAQIEEDFSYLEEVLRSIRAVRAEMQIPPRNSTDIYVLSEDEEALSFLRKHQIIVSTLIPIERLYFGTENEYKESLPSFSSTGIVKTIKIIIPLPEDLKAKEAKRLQKEQEKLLKQISQCKSRLDNQEFLSKAPQELVETTKQQLKEANASLQAIQKKLQEI